MVKVAFSSSFKRAFKKKIKGKKDLEERFFKKLEEFINNPFSPGLRTHKLSGKLKDLWSFSIDYDLRVIFFFEGKDRAVFVSIGTHDEVY